MTLILALGCLSLLALGVAWVCYELSHTPDWALDPEAQDDPRGRASR